MKPLKAVLFALRFVALSALLMTNAHSTEVRNTPYQIHIFDFDQQHIPDSNQYQKRWKRMTGFEHSGLHWEQFIVIYTNKGDSVYRHNFLQYSAWFDDPEDEDNEPQYETYPVGTALIKENYRTNNGKPGDAVSITVMIKQSPGFNPSGGDWEYMQFDHLGKMLLKGKGSDPQINKTCANCHENVADRDYIFANFYSGSNH